MKKLLFTLFILIIISTLFYIVTSSAVSNTIREPENTAIFNSKNVDAETDDNFVNLSTDGSKLTIEYRSNIADIYGNRDVLKYKICLTKADLQYRTLGEVEPTFTDDYNCFSVTYDLNDYSFDSGIYYLYILRARNEYQMNRTPFGDGGNCYRNAVIELTSDGTVNIKNYKNIVNNNISFKSKAAYNYTDAYTDKTMSDVPYCLADSSDKPADLTESQLEYISNKANELTAGYTTNYQKALAIYKYVAENTYYDVYSNTQHKLYGSVNNPYININKIETDGKTSTTCVGYASMMTALLRAADIPTRVVYGYHLSIPSENWSDINFEASDFKADEHYWVEFYNNGRWVTCDANMGTSNKWERKSSSDTGTWIGGNAISDSETEKSLNNLTYFDPSEEQFAISHCTMGFYSKALITKSSDVTKLKTIFNQANSSGVTNATLLGAKENSIKNSSILSWNLDKIYATPTTGAVEKIDWAGTSSTAGKFYGDCDLSSMKSLKWFTASYNKGMTSLNLNGDSSLLSIYASSCKLSSFTATGCTSIEKINVGYNPLKSAKYTFLGSKTATITANTGGTFYVTFDGTKHTLVANPNNGYYFLGWYNSSGTKVSSSATYNKNATASFTLTAKFKKLATPTNVTIKNTTSTAQKISWDKVSGASGYYVYKSTSKNSGYLGAKITSGSTTSITKTGLIAGKTYYYYVVAFRNIDGKDYPLYSDNSDKVSKKLKPPTPSIKVSSTTKKVATVKWSKIANVNGYEVVRATSKTGTYKKVKTYTKNSSTSTVTFNNTKLKSGKTYYYKVRSYKTVNGTKVYSSYSSTKSIKVK